MISHPILMMAQAVITRAQPYQFPELGIHRNRKAIYVLFAKKDVKNELWDGVLQVSLLVGC